MNHRLKEVKNMREREREMVCPIQFLVIEPTELEDDAIEHLPNMSSYLHF